MFDFLILDVGKVCGQGKRDAASTWIVGKLANIIKEDETMQKLNDSPFAEVLESVQVVSTKLWILGLIKSILHWRPILAGWMLKAKLVTCFKASEEDPAGYTRRMKNEEWRNGRSSVKAVKKQLKQL